MRWLRPANSRARRRSGMTLLATAKVPFHTEDVRLDLVAERIAARALRRNHSIRIELERSRLSCTEIPTRWSVRWPTCSKRREVESARRSHPCARRRWQPRSCRCRSWISDADLPFVFDRFYRSPAARAHPGSGLRTGDRSSGSRGAWRHSRGAHQPGRCAPAADAAARRRADRGSSRCRASRHGAAPSSVYPGFDGERSSHWRRQFSPRPALADTARVAESSSTPAMASHRSTTRFAATLISGSGTLMVSAAGPHWLPWPVVEASGSMPSTRYVPASSHRAIPDATAENRLR